MSSPTPNLPGAGHAKDLMSRLQHFLPQIHEANRLLETAADSDATNNNKISHQIDVGLQSEPEDDNSSSSASLASKDHPLIAGAADNENDDVGDHMVKRKQEADHPPPSSSAPAGCREQETIQIEFAVGDMKENPMLQQMLAMGQEEETDNNGEDSDNDGDPHDNNTGKRKAIQAMLQEQQPTTTPPSGKSTTEKRKKVRTGPLITEMD